MTKQYRKKILYKKVLKDLGYSDQKIERLRSNARYERLIRDLKLRRKEKQFTQIDLASLTGIPRTTISKIESGFRNTTIDTLMILADAVDLDLRLVRVNS